MNELLAVFGRLHPLLLHLPIGLVVALAALELWGALRRSPPPMAVMASLAQLTQLTAAAALLTGLVLVREGGYPEELATQHRNTAIAFVLVCIALGRLARRSEQRFAFRAMLVAALALVAVTGHMGASITHGRDFLLEPLRERAPSTHQAPGAPGEADEPHTNDAPVSASYSAHVAPLLEALCVNCHGEDKRKGRLALHTRAGIERGGASGAALAAGDSHASLLVQRLRLPHDDEEHMPPADKLQPTEHEIALLAAWIDAGAPFDSGFAFAQLDALGERAPRLDTPPTPSSASAPPTREARAMPPKEALAALAAHLVHAQPIAQDDPLLWIDFAAPAAEVDDALVCRLLTPLAEHVAELSVARAPIHDAALECVGRLTLLRRLDLRATSITDAGIAHLRGARELRELNLAQTAVGDDSIEVLASLPKLARLHLWRSAISADGRARLIAARPELELDTGEEGGAAALEVEGELKFTSDALLPGAAETPAALAPLNAKCPVSDSPVNPKYSVVFEGRVIGFCCPNCPKEFWADPRAFADKLK